MTLRVTEGRPSGRPLAAARHEQIETLKDLCLRTPLVRAGGPVSAVISPPDAAYDELAHSITGRIKQLTGATVPIIAADASDPWPTGAESAIALGSMLNNPLILELYRHSLCFSDAAYPGRSGHELRTVHNPRGDGRNVVLAGGSDAEGVREAASRLARALEPRGETLELPRTIDTASALNVPFEPTPEVRRTLRAEIANRLTSGDKQTSFVPVLVAGLLYYQTGDLRWSDFFRDAFAEFYDRARSSYTAVGMAEYWCAALIRIWDVVEESPSFDDDARLHITNRILDLVRAAAGMPYLRDMPAGRLRWNHETFNALSLLYGARYFGRSYDLPEAREWDRVARHCLDPQTRAFSTWDQSGSYGSLTPRHALLYAFSTGDLSVFACGAVRRLADWVIAIHDNLGTVVTFGDCSPYAEYVRSDAYFPILARAAWYYRDGRYTWFMRYLRGSRPARQDYTIKRRRAFDRSGVFRGLFWNWAEGAFWTDVPPQLPRDLLGIRVLPLDEMYHEAEAATVPGGLPPLERCFEKVSFRASFSPSSPYLLLEGPGGGKHGHRDENAILRYTDRRRIWLVDNGYTQENTERHHNRVIVVRDGASALPPAFATIDVCCDLPHAGATSTCSPGYNATDWSRHIVWVKNRFFVVVDEVSAREAGEFDLRCLWHVLGCSTLAGDALTVEQRGERFVLASAGTATGALRTEDRRFVGRAPFWQGYRHAGNTVSVWEQRINRRMGAGQKACFVNLFGAGPDVVRTLRQVRRVADACVYLPGEGAYAGAGGVQDGLVSTDAGLFYLSPSLLFAARATRASWGEEIFSSSVPVSLELDPATGIAAVDLDEPGEIMLRLRGAVRRLTLPAGRRRFRLPAGAPLPVHSPIAKTGAKATSARAATVGPRLSRSAGLRRLWRAETGAAVSALAVVGSARNDGGALVAGTVDGRLVALDRGGKTLWTQELGSRINDVHIARPPDRKDWVAAVGCENRLLRLLDGEGRELWRFRCDNGELGTVGRVKRVLIAELAAKTEPVVLAATGSWFVYALSLAGQPMWRFQSYAHESTVLQTYDLNGDGAQEILQANNYFHVRAITADGKELWAYYTGPSGPIITSLAATAGGLAAGVSDSCVHFLALDGKLLWKSNTGGEVVAVHAVDLDDDGRQEILAGSESYCLLAYTQGGELLWRTDLDGTPIWIDTCARGVLAATDGGLRVLSRDGRRTGFLPAVGTTSAVLLPGGRTVVLGDRQGLLTAVGLPSGTPRSP